MAVILVSFTHSPPLTKFKCMTLAQFLAIKHLKSINELDPVTDGPVPSLVDEMEDTAPKLWYRDRPQVLNAYEIC